MSADELKLRTKKFAHRCILLCAALPDNNLGRHIARQLIRSSTSVAANFRATNLAQSKKEFISKLSIVIEEIDESFFWIEFVKDEKLVEEIKISSLLDEANQLTKIFAASRISARKNNK
jgi:four helix bundle protein